MNLRSGLVRFGLALVATYLVYLMVGYLPDALAIRKLGTDLQADELGVEFPREYFVTVLPEGALPGRVYQVMQGYEKIKYYRLPIAGSADSVVVQRFVYPLVWSEMNVDVLYRAGRVFDVDLERGRIPSRNALSPQQAYQHLDWSPL